MLRPLTEPRLIGRVSPIPQRRSGDAVARHVPHHVALGAMQRRIRRFAKAGGVTEHRIEHRLHIGRRAADDLQDLRCRGLRLERLPSSR